jgi:hypothetical protein
MDIMLWIKANPLPSLVLLAWALLTLVVWLENQGGQKR